MKHHESEGAAPPLRRRALRALPRVALALIALTFVVLCTRLAHAHVFGRFTPFDDEGFFMMALLQLQRGRVLYDELPNIYGPLSYLLKLLVHAFVPLDHRHVRLTTVLAWQGAALLCAATALKLGRSPLLALFVYLQTFFHLTALALEPGHPQELGVLLVAAAPLAAALAGARHRAAALALGALAAAALLTKINIGLYLGFAVVWALSARLQRAGPRPWLWRLPALGLAAFALALPLILMRTRLHEPAAAVYAQLFAASALAAAIALGAERRPGDVAPRALAFFFLGAGASAALIIGAVLVLGSSPGALLRCLIIDPARFADRLYYPQPLIKSPRAYAAIGLALACVVAGLRVFDTAPRRRAWLYAALKIAFGIVVAVNAYNGVYRLFYRAPPLLWILLLPLGEDRRGAEGPRWVLGAAALLQTLVAYPIPGSQVQWAGFLLITAGAVAAADGLRFMAGAAPGALARLRRFAPVLAIPAALALYPLFFLRPPLRTGRFELDVRGLVERYRAGVPLPLAGAEGLRLPREEAARLLWVASNLRALDRPFVVLPNNQSFYFFGRAPTPPPELFFHWNSLDPERQRRLIAVLEAEEALAVVVDEELIRLWEVARTGEPIRAWLEDETRPLFVLGDLSIRVRRGDKGRYDQALSPGVKAGDPRGHPLPAGLLAGPEPASFGLRFRAAGPGVILAAGGERWLSVAEDGRLALRGAGEGPAVADGAWHHLALVLASGRARLFLDGGLVLEAPGAMSSASLDYGPGSPGTLGELRFARRAWDAGEVALRSRRGR